MSDRQTSKLARRLSPQEGGVVAMGQSAYQHWRATRTIRLGAGLAYYALFAVVPLLSLAAALIARFLSTEDAQEFVAGAIDGLVDGDAQNLAASITEQLDGASAGLGIIGFGSLLVAASLLFLALQDALNVIWEAPVRSGLGNTVRRRLVAFGIVLAVAAFLISSLLIQAVVGLADRLVPGQLEIIEPMASLLTAAGSWAVGVAVVALVFRQLPYAEVRWRDAFVGGAITAGLLALGTALIGAYLSRFGSSSLSGVAGGVALFLLWVYYEAQILLAGAVLTKVLGDRHHVAASPAR